jgi:hypothetical protein
MCLLVEKLLVTCCGGYSPGLRDFRFRITERSNTKPSGSVSVHATFFNKQVRYHALKRMQEVLLRNHARYCASAEIALTPFHLSGMARYALRRVSAQIATQWIMAWFPRHVQPWAIDGLTVAFSWLDLHW